MLRPRTPAAMTRLLDHLIDASKRHVAHRDHGLAALGIVWEKRASRLAAGYRALNAKQATHFTID